MVVGDVSHEEGGESKSVSPSELGFLQAERSERQRCSSDLRAAPEHFTSRIVQIPQKLYISIYLRGYSLQDTSDVQNKERIFLPVIYEAS